MQGKIFFCEKGMNSLFYLLYIWIRFKWTMLCWWVHILNECMFSFIKAIWVDLVGYPVEINVYFINVSITHRVKKYFSFGMRSGLGSVWIWSEILCLTLDGPSHCRCQIDDGDVICFCHFLTLLLNLWKALISHISFLDVSEKGVPSISIKEMSV